MKLTHVFLTASIILSLAAASPIVALDETSGRFVEHMGALKEPESPEAFDGSLIFTASDTLHMVGIAFAHENYAKVHWFKKLLRSPGMETIVLPSARGKKGLFSGEKKTKLTAPIDSGLLVLIYDYPKESAFLKGDKSRVFKYRMIVDGIWTTDPWNPLVAKESETGLSYSWINLQEMATKDMDTFRIRKPFPVIDREGVHFTCKAEAGEMVALAGSFNNWDPFMYELEEQGDGTYSIALNLPPGTYQYTFVESGESIPDQENPRKVYTRDGRIVSEIVIQ